MDMQDHPSFSATGASFPLPHPELLDQNIYDVPCEDSPTPEPPLLTPEKPPLTSRKPSLTTREPSLTSEEPPYTQQEPPSTSQEPLLTAEKPTSTDFAKLRQNFENGFPEAGIKKSVTLMPKPILVSKLKTDIKFNTDLKKNKTRNEGGITFTLPKRDNQLDLDRENIRMDDVFFVKDRDRYCSSTDTDNSVVEFTLGLHAAKL
ncbi:unnamed protein product [Arctia plantaginis]|uniref:Uncharacterized protein n=1 Tax=Arctia plantaginis TaxID=874455 RepID=A0A8S0ZPA8_ARCPL|nr:unnamed protein product [Arctia plantaginis]